MIPIKKSFALPKIGTVFMPPEMANAITASIAREAQRLMQTEGVRALQAPRSAALAHETVHAIVGTAEGKTIVRAILQCATPWGTVWSGKTNESQPCRFSENMPTEVFLSRIRYLLGGVAGDVVLDWDAFRRGSSLDEVVTTQTICDGLIEDGRTEFTDHKELWNACWIQTCKIIKHNEAAARDLMRNLDRTRQLRGKPLAASLPRVEQTQ